MNANSIRDNQDEALSDYLNALFGVSNADVAPFAAPAAPAAASAIWFCFTVSGLRVALPADSVGAVVNFAERAGTPASELHLGYVEYRGRLVPVLGGSQLVMAGVPHLPYQRIVIAADGRYALAVHGVEPELDIPSAEVCWKTDTTRRRWLAGTYIQKRCALLDIEELAAIAAAEDARGSDALN